MDKALTAIDLLQIFVDCSLNPLAIYDLAFLEADVSEYLLFRKDRVSLDLDLADTVNPALGDGNSDPQRVIHRREQRDREIVQDRKTGSFEAKTDNLRLTDAGLKVPF